jgi:hypothetical protein
MKLTLLLALAVAPLFSQTLNWQKDGTTFYATDISFPLAVFPPVRSSLAICVPDAAASITQLQVTITYQTEKKEPTLYITAWIPFLAHVDGKSCFATVSPIPTSQMKQAVVSPAPTVFALGVL